MTMRKLLPFALLLLVPLSAAAEQGRTYIIKKGDTLHGISQRFLKDPAYWPNLWANNPDIRNPHFIYPGQELHIFDGRIEVVTAKPKPPAPVPMPTPTPVAIPAAPQATAPVPQAPPAPAPEPEVTIKVPANLGYLADEDIAGVGEVVDAMDNRLLIASGDSVFVKFAPAAGDVRPGALFSLIEVGEPLTNPATGKPLGWRIVELGSLRVSDVRSDIASGVIEGGTREVLRGTRLLPYRAPVQTIALKKGRKALTGEIIGTPTNKSGQAKGDLVFLDLGRNDNLEVGNLVTISRKRLPSELAKLPHDMELPEQLIGTAVVTDIGGHTASALVLKSTGAIYIGDRITVANGE